MVVLGTFFIVFLIVIPSFAYLILIYSYRNTLSKKLNHFKNIFSGNELLLKYYKHYFNPDLDSKNTFEQDFTSFFQNIYFSRRQFIIPVIILMVLTCLGAYTLVLHFLDTIIYSGNDKIIHEYIIAVRNKVPSEVLVAFAGAYVWGLSDMLYRMRNVDLTPNSLHFLWLRLVIVSALGFIISYSHENDRSSVYLLCFAIGTFPTTTLKDYLSKYAISYLKLIRKEKANVSNLDFLSGVSPSLVKRLNEENIYTVCNLAYTDPILLYLRTNIGWKIILDLIDQALLFAYLGEEYKIIRKHGIRGAMEAGTLHYEYKDRKNKKAKKVIQSCATTLNMDFDSTVYLLKTLREDFFIEFIWALWETTVSFNNEEYINRLNLENINNK